MRFRLGFQSLVFAACLAVAMGVMAVSALLFNRASRDHQIDQTKASLLRSLSLTQVLLDSLTDQSPESLKSFTQDLARKLGAQIAFFSSTGKALILNGKERAAAPASVNSSTPSEISQALGQGSGFNLRTEPGGGEFLYVAWLYKGSNGSPLVLRAGLPLDQLEGVAFPLIDQIWNAVVAGVLLSMAASIVISRIIGQPVNELTRTSRAIAEGDLFRRIRRYPHHEIGELAEVFNRMADTIQEKIKNVTEARDHLEAILKGMAEGVLVTDAQGRILFANKALRGLLNLERDPAGSMPSEIIRNADLVSAMRQIRQGTPQLFRQIRTLGSDPRHLEARVVRISQDNQLAGCVTVLRDNTDQIRTEQIRRDFVANVSHELRTPLTAIQGAAEVLLGGALENPEDANRFVEMIQRQSARLKQLSQDLMDLSLIESGRKKPNTGKVLASELAEDILSTMGELAIKHEVQFEAHLPEDDLQFRADQSQVEEALINLVDNAIKYSGQGGRVILSIQAMEGQIELSVSDNGPGIEAEHLPRLFERFYRVDSNRSRQMGGTGLGLAIVKHLAQAQGGRVEVESEPGKGSAFTLIIPQPERNPSDES
jgi:two-component system phosphate regulon sensor histidine kinase PhoR